MLVPHCNTDHKEGRGWRPACQFLYPHGLVEDMKMIFHCNRGHKEGHLLQLALQFSRNMHLFGCFGGLKMTFHCSKGHKELLE